MVGTLLEPWGTGVQCLVCVGHRPLPFSVLVAHFGFSDNVLLRFTVMEVTETPVPPGTSFATPVPSQGAPSWPLPFMTTWWLPSLAPGVY